MWRVMNKLFSVQYLNDIYKSYSEYVTQKEMQAICQIGKTSAYKLNKSGTIPYFVENTRTGMRYKISKMDVIIYLYQHDSIFYLDQFLNQALQQFFANLLGTQPNLLRTSQVEDLFGFSKSMIQRRILSKHLQAMKFCGDWYISKESLSYFFADKDCLSLTDKSKAYIALLNDFRMMHGLFYEK